MKYKSLESVIKEMHGGLKTSVHYRTLENSIRDIVEGKKKTHEIETDPNDQITVGTYKTKSFEQSPEAQKLYMNLPKTTDKIAAEKSAVLHDQLFDMHKDVLAKQRASKTEVEAANELVKKIGKLAKDMGMEKEHSYLSRVMNDFNSHLDDSGNVFDSDKLDMEKIQNRFGTPSKDITKEKQDSDIDNSKMFITRSIKGQRKLKIIDND